MLRLIQFFVLSWQKEHVDVSGTSRRATRDNLCHPTSATESNHYPPHPRFTLPASMPYRKVPLASIQTLTFYADALTSHRRTTPIRPSPFPHPFLTELPRLTRPSSTEMSGHAMQIIPA